MFEYIKENDKLLKEEILKLRWINNSRNYYSWYTDLIRNNEKNAIDANININAQGKIKKYLNYQ